MMSLTQMLNNDTMEDLQRSNKHKNLVTREERNIESTK